MDARYPRTDPFPYVAELLSAVAPHVSVYPQLPKGLTGLHCAQKGHVFHADHTPTSVGPAVAGLMRRTAP